MLLQMRRENEDFIFLQVMSNLQLTIKANEREC